MTALTDLQMAAALCEQVYRRSDLDQQLGVLPQQAPPGALPEGFGGSDIIAHSSNINGFDNENGFYYNDDTGFVGRIIEANGKVFLVLRGSDLSGSWSAVPGSLGVTLDLDYADSFDWSNNTDLGLGTTGYSQLDDALKLLEEAKNLASARGAEVVVAGQSLGGGLAGLITAIANFRDVTHPIKGYAIAAAPFKAQLWVEAAFQALSELDPDLYSRENVRQWLLSGSGYVTLDDAFRATDGNGFELIVQSNIGFLTQQDLDDLAIRRNVIYSEFLSFQEAQLAIHGIDGEALVHWSIFGDMHFIAPTSIYNISNLDSFGAAVSKHGPALHNLVIRTEGIEGQKFRDLMLSDSVIQNAFLIDTAISSPFEHDRADPSNSPSAMHGGGANPSIIYNALWKSVGTAGGLYGYFYNFFKHTAQSGAAAVGIAEEEASLHSGIVKLALGILRDAAKDTGTIQ